MKRVGSYAVVLVLLSAAACTSHRAPGEAALQLTGRIRLTSSGGKVSHLVRPQTVRRGDTVKVERGTATLNFSGKRSLELRRGSVVKIDRLPTVVSGSALLVTEDAPFSARVGGSTVAVSGGAARVNSGLGIEAGTYSGSVTLTSAGRKLFVPALRQAAIPTLGVLPPRPEPLRLRPSDAWDRRYLGAAIELGDELQTRSDALTGELPRGEGRSASFIADLLPALGKESSFGSDLVDTNRPAGETVVGASIALGGKIGSFNERWVSIFSFRDEGAAWGLVALDQKVADVGTLSSSLETAMGKVQSINAQLAAPPTATDVTTPVEPASTVPTTEPATGGSGGTGGAGGAGGGTGGGGGGGTGGDAPAPPAPSPLQPVTDAVSGLLNGVAGLLGGG